MHIFKFALRRLLRHWRLYFFVLIGFSFASGLLAGLPIYSQAIAFHTLATSIEDGHPIERNFEVRGSSSVLTGGLLIFVDEIIGDLISERLEFREITIGVHRNDPIISIDLTQRVPPNNINIYSIDKLTNKTLLVEGQWPEFKPPYTHEEILRAMTTPPDIEAVIGLNAALESGLKVGDIVVDDSGRHFPIVGIVEPLDPTEDAWWGNLTIFNLYRKPGLNEDTIYLALIVHQGNLREYYPDHATSWRILVNHELITPDNVISIEKRIINFTSRIESSNASLRTNLPNMLQKYRENLSTTRMVVFLLSAQALIFILYGLILIESLLFERAQSEFATLVGRGSGSVQILVLTGTEGLIIALIAGTFTGPLLTSSLLFIWSKLSDWNLSMMIGKTGMYLSLIGAGIGWLALLFSTLSFSRTQIVSWQKRLSRPDKKIFWQKYYLDILIAVISGLAYWQLSDTDSFLIQRIEETDLTDPLLLISPTLFVFSISILFLRVYPYLLRIISWAFHSSPGIVIPLSLKKLSRDPIKPSHMILLISIATSATLFSNSYENSLLINQKSISHYLSGADIRITQNDLSITDLEKVSGILNVAQVFRHVTQLRTGRTVTLLAIDPSTISKVTGYPTGMTNITIHAIANVLKNEGIAKTSEQNGLTDENVSLESSKNKDKDYTQPAIYSYAAIPPNMEIGDHQEITILTSPINFEIHGIIKNFPTLGNAFILTNLTVLAENMDLERSEFYADFELWLTVNPEKYSDVISIPFIQENLISDARQELLEIRENAFTEGVVGAYNLNTFTLSILSTVIFSLITFSTASNRKYEFGILQAEGLSSYQLIRLLLTEGMLIIVMSICTGTLIGIGLTYIMRPYLNIALMRSFPQMVVYKLFIDWSQVAIRNGFLISCYLVSLGFAIYMLIRIGIHQVMRIGDE